MSISTETVATAGDTISLPVAALVANDYNPNEMTAEQMAELVAEVQHLGRLPKPVVVRPNGSGYVIVDGEHGWRAAQTVGLTEVPCEIVEVDDFEARRQTFKRNQHGTHHPVRLGQMFEQMMGARSLSQRALAKEIEISEGTVRNALSYAEAATSLRNCYAGGNPPVKLKSERVEHDIGALSVRQVREYLQMPEGLRHHWLAAGADLTGAPGWHWIHPSLYDEWPKYGDFQTTFRRLRAWSTWESRWCIGGLTRDTLRPYTQHYLKNAWVVRMPDMMDAALETIIDTSSQPVRFLVTADEFATVVSNGGMQAGSHSAFIKRLEGAVSLKGFTVPPMRNFRLREQVRAQEIATSAPDYIRDSALSVREKYAVWKTEAPKSMDGAPAEQVRRKLANSSSLHAVDDEDAERIVTRAFHSASARKRITHVYHKLSDRQLAERVARWFPIYNAKDSVEVLMIGALTDKLLTFSRAELICMTQMAEAWEWDAAMADVIKTAAAIHKACG